MVLGASTDTLIRRETTKGRGTALTAEIVVDHHDRLARPAILKRPIDQPVLQPGRFPVSLNLLYRGLADVDDRQTFLMPPDDLARLSAAALRQQQIALHHRLSPRRLMRFGFAAGPSARAPATRPAAV